MRSFARLRWLCLAGNLIGPDGASELADELETNTTLEYLALGSIEKSFRPNCIKTDGLRVMLNSLGKNKNSSLTTLLLCHNGLSSEAGECLADFLKQSTCTVQHLDLSHNPLASEGICQILPVASQLRALDIANTGCSGDLIHSRLCTLLQDTETLAHLSLARNPIEGRPMRKIARALANCSPLVSLSLQGTSMDTEGLTSLADAILSAPRQSLTILDLSDNNLSQLEAASALAHVIANSLLHVLKLNRNPIGDAGVRELADALDPQICPDTALQHLELGSCRISATGASHLLGCLASNENIRVLKLGDNFLGDNLDVSLFEALHNIHEIQLQGNRLSHNVLQKVAKVCARNRKAAHEETPARLRAEMHRLLYQETRLEEVKHQMAADDSLREAHLEAIAEAEHAMQTLLANDEEKRQQAVKQIQQEERAMEAQKEALVKTEEALQKAIKYYQNEQKKLQEELVGKENQLLELNEKSQQVEELYERRKREQPLEVKDMQEKIEAAVLEEEVLQEKAMAMRRELKALQEQHRIDFKT
jgi:Leucine-rich repeat (LRR) protein